MSLGSPVAGDVPGIFDLVLNGQGYIFYNDPAGTPSAQYGYSPTFLARTNVSGQYGDNEQEFYLAVVQKDWASGAGQKYFRNTEEQSARYFDSYGIDTSVPGRIQCSQSYSTPTLTANPVGGIPRGVAVNDNLVYCSSTKLYELDNALASTDQGAHGLGAAPSRFAFATDGTDVYFSTETAGTVGVRKWDGSGGAGAFTTFSATPANAICFHNNALYGLRASNATLYTYSTAGVATSVGTWQQADGGSRGGTPRKLVSYGGKLVILWSDGPNGAELWQYDGVGVSKLAEFSPNFFAYDMVVFSGLIFISGYHLSKDTSGNYLAKPAIYFYAGGAMDILWESPFLRQSYQAMTLASDQDGPVLTIFDGSLWWVAPGNTVSASAYYFWRYNPTTGAVATPHADVYGGASGGLIATRQLLLRYVDNATTAQALRGERREYGGNIANYATGFLVTSLYDFDSSLIKRFKSIRVDFSGSGTVGIDYQLEDNITGTWTGLTASATSGTPVDITQTGRAISFRIKLTPATAAGGSTPILKRIEVKAAPILTSFRLRRYTLNLHGRDGLGHVQVRDGASDHPLDGLAQANNLVTAATATAPFSITDRFGTFTGLVQPDGFELREVRLEEFVGVITVRET